MPSIISNILLSPLKIGRKFRRNKVGALTQQPPISPPDTSECEIGEYCIRTSVETYDNNNKLDKTFIGYSKNLNIIDKTKNVCERFKRNGTTCQEPSVVFKGGDCIDQIFMKENNGELIRLGML